MSTYRADTKLQLKKIVAIKRDKGIITSDKKPT